MSNSVDISRKADDAYPTGAPGPCSQFLMESELLIYFCFFVRISCHLLCVSVFSFGPSSLDCVLFIFAIILVPLVTFFKLNQCVQGLLVEKIQSFKK